MNLGRDLQTIERERESRAKALRALAYLRQPLAILPKPITPNPARFRPLTSQHVIPKQAKVIAIGGGFTIRTKQGGESLKALIAHTQEREGLEVTGKKESKGKGKRGFNRSTFAKQVLELI